MLGMWHTSDVTHGLHVTARHNAHTALRLLMLLVILGVAKRKGKVLAILWLQSMPWNRNGPRPGDCVHIN